MFPPRATHGLLDLMSLAPGPRLAGFAAVIFAVAQPLARLAACGLNAFLRDGTEMMQERAAGHGQPESRPARPAEIFVVFVAAQLGIAVKITDVVKYAPVHHETDAVRHAAAMRVFQPPHEIRRVRRKIIIRLTLAQGRADNVKKLLFGKMDQAFEAARRHEHVVIHHHRPARVRQFRALGPGEAAAAIFSIIDRADFGVAGKKFRRAIGGGIVDDDDLIRRDAGAPEAVETLPCVSQLVEDRNDDADVHYK